MKLEEQLRFQANLLNTVEEAVIATDLQGTIIYWNRFAESLYGWPAEEAIGRNILHMTCPDVAQEQAAEIMAQVGAGRSWSGEFTVKRRDGTAFPAFVTDSPIYNEQGELIGVVGISYDITQRKRLEAALRESERQANQILRSSPIGIIVHDAGGMIRYVNQAFSKILGYSDTEMRKEP